jgi:hypothetical protein
MAHNEPLLIKGNTMTNLKHAAKTAAFALGTVVFPRVKPREVETFDIEAHIAAVQASWLIAVKDDLK